MPWLSRHSPLVSRCTSHVCVRSFRCPWASVMPHLTSPHLTSTHLNSPHLTSPHLTSPCLTLPCLAFPSAPGARARVVVLHDAAQGGAHVGPLHGRPSHRPTLCVDRHGPHRHTPRRLPHTASGLPCQLLRPLMTGCMTRALQWPRRVDSADAVLALELVCMPCCTVAHLT